MDQLASFFLAGCSFTEMGILGRKHNINPYAFTQIKFDGEEP